MFTEMRNLLMKGRIQDSMDSFIRLRFHKVVSITQRTEEAPHDVVRAAPALETRQARKARQEIGARKANAKKGGKEEPGAKCPIGDLYLINCELIISNHILQLAKQLPRTPIPTKQLVNCYLCCTSRTARKFVTRCLPGLSTWISHVISLLVT